jgi:hypothetical protein
MEFILNTQPAKYSMNATQEVAAFLDGVAPRVEAGETSAAILDSVKNEASQVKVPKALDILLGKVNKPEHEQKILDGIVLGLGRFEAEHGFKPTADLVEAAIQQGNSAFDMIGPNGPMLDAISNTASSAHSEPMSLQPNRAVVAILSAIAEAIPFAGYLPVDIGSNQSKLAILSHIAGSNYGDYTTGAIMDGTNAGQLYGTSARYLAIDITATFPIASKFTQTNLASNPGYCDPAGTGVPVLRGRTVMYVNGKVAARDAASGGGATSPMSGTVQLGSTTYTCTATVTIATGVVSVAAFTPALPVGTDVTIEGFVDYEAAPGLIPLVQVRADTYDIYANPWRSMTNISIDAAGQLRNELGLDGNSEAIMAMRSQMELERHYIALGKVARLAKNNSQNFDFEWSARNQQMNRAQIWQDLQAKLTNVDQNMANATMDHGVTHYYVGSWLAGIMHSLPRDMFEPSGIAVRPGIYRVGRLFGKYEIYYTPRVATQAANLTTAKMIGVGRSTQVARCPIILGDAVSATFLDLARNSDLKQQAAIYGRNFTEVNPHEQSALGCCEVNLVGLG